MGHYRSIARGTTLLAGAGGGQGAAERLALYSHPAPGGAATLLGARPGTSITVSHALGRPVAMATDSGTAALLPASTPTGVYVVRAGSWALRLIVK